MKKVIHINNICWGCPPLCGAGKGHDSKYEKVHHEDAERATCKKCRKLWGLGIRTAPIVVHGWGGAETKEREVKSKTR